MNIMNVAKLKTKVIIPILILQAFVFTSCLKDREPSAPTEIKRPDYSAALPAAGSLNFPVNGAVQIKFTEPMNLSTFTGRFTLKDFNGNVIETAISQIDSNVFFTPKSTLQKASLYYVELRGRVRDAHNNSIEINNEGVFNDTTLITSTWFYTAGDYSTDGYYPIFLRDRKSGNVRMISYIDSVVTTLTGLFAPEGMALAQNDQYLLVSNTTKDQVLIINTITGATEATIPVSAHPSTIVVKGNYAFVTCVNGKAICKINVSSKTLETTYALSFYPGKLAVSPDGSKLYTLDQVTRALNVLNASTGAVINTIANAVSKIVSGELVMDKSSGRLYVCDTKGFKLLTLESDGSALTTAVSFGTKEPVEVAISGAYVYVAVGTTIIQYDKATFALVKTVTFSTPVKSLTIIPSSDLMYATLATSIAVVDRNTLTVLKEKDMISSGIESIISGENKR